MHMNLSRLLESFIDREPWHAAVHGATKSQTELSDWTELNQKKQKQTHSHRKQTCGWQEVVGMDWKFGIQLSSVQLLSRVRLLVTPWTVACQASPFIINSQSLLKLVSIESVMPSNHLILCHPLPLLPPIPLSIRVFSRVSSLHQVAKVLEFQHQPFQWIFRTDFL